MHLTADRPSKFEEYISGALSAVKYGDFLAKGEKGGVIIAGAGARALASRAMFVGADASRRHQRAGGLQPRLDSGVPAVQRV